MEIALKMVTHEFNPIQMTFLRFFIGSLILLPFAVRGLKNKKFRLKAKDIGFFALTGFICVVISMVLYQLALLYAPASTIAVLLSSIPVFTVLFAFLFLHEQVYYYTVISIIINIIGIIVIINPRQISGSIEGIILILLSSIAFAAYSVIGRNRIQDYGGTVLTCFSFLCGSIEMFFLILITQTPFVSNFLLQNDLNLFANVPLLQGISVHTLPNLIFTGVFVTGLGYLFYFLGMEATSTATGSLVFFIKPALASILASIILKEIITANMILGIILIILGSTISFVGDHRMSKIRSHCEMHE
jgi:drug/metabolite transporter (DMT)-like permease